MFRAETPGGVVLTGDSSVLIEGQHVVVHGLFLTNASASGAGVKVTGTACRLTESAVVGGNHKFQLHLNGRSNRIDHCYFAAKTNDSPTVQIEVAGYPNYHRLDHNHFGPRPPLGRNGGETIRVGYSHQSMTNSRTRVEQNLFEQCDGEIEIISNKSCENTYRANTFLDCAGMLTLRHGNRCIVDGNFFLGHGKAGSGGVRVIGEGHVVINNYMDGIRQGGFWITAGIPDSPLNGYFQARHCLIAFNTVVDSRGPGLELNAGFGTSRRSLRPEDITLANNLFALAEGAPLSRGEPGTGFSWLGNLSARSEGLPQLTNSGVRVLDARLTRGRDGLWRPAPDSPVRGAAQGAFPDITTDIDGQKRSVPSDVGADQVSTSPVVNRPLKAADVGPGWMSRVYAKGAPGEP